LSGKPRELLSAPGTLTLHDVGTGGRALISRDAMRAGAIGLAPGETKERDLSWQDWTVPFAISDDGKLLLFTEAGEAGGGEYAVFTRDTDGASAVRLGQGSSRALSSDGKWALVLRQNVSPPDFVLLPTGVGQQRALPTGNVIPSFAQFLPDSKRLVFDGHEGSHASRVYVMNLDGGQPRAITPDGFSLRGRSLSPDGKHLAVLTGDGIALVSVDGGEPQLVHGSPGDEDVYIVSIGDALVPLLADPTPLTFFGHTHLQGGFFANGSSADGFRPEYRTVGQSESVSLQLKPNSRYMINPGSVGQPRDGDWRAAFCLLDEAAQEITFYRVPYDLARAQGRILMAGLPERLAQRLRDGR